MIELDLFFPSCFFFVVVVVVVFYNYPVSPVTSCHKSDQSDLSEIYLNHGRFPLERYKACTSSRYQTTTSSQLSELTGDFGLVETKH